MSKELRDVIHGVLVSHCEIQTVPTSCQCGQKSFGATYDDHLAAVLAAAIQTYSEGKWVSVDMSLPAPRIRVNAVEGNLIVTDCFVDYDGTWKYSHNELPCKFTITDWMPLPALPSPPDMPTKEGK